MSQPSPPQDDDVGPMLSDPRTREWFEEHLTELRRDAYGQRIQYTILAAALVVGLVSYAAGYLLRPSPTTEPIGLLADLLYTFGWALWTATIVAVLLELIPEAKRRQVRRALEAYEAIKRDQPPGKP
jgi:hypothetical protein